MTLVIVESPAKCKTIRKFLGPGYKVLASYGHIRDLPEKELGVDIEHGFKPHYVVIPKAKKIVQFLKKEVKKADTCLISTDPDREGEAIAFHLVFLLGLNGKKPYQRIVFHEITKPAIEEALQHPRKINKDLVDSQQARRILDRLVGYKLSPFLWKKVGRGLSAGRVQSVAVRLVVEREREIEKFIPQEYWTIEARLRNLVSKNSEFKALLIKKDGKVIPKLGIKTKEEADKILNELEGAEYKVEKIDKKEIKRHPLPPFTTSTLQQTAWQRFRWPAKLTMSVAQQLYEKGWCTYHRTDSLNLSNLALASAKKFIIKNFGENYYQFRRYKTKSKLTQEAHEAIRPTYSENRPEKISAKLDQNQRKLYELIWRRFIACQMASAIFNSTTVNILASRYTFRAVGQMLKFDGFLKVYPVKFEETEIPPLEQEEILKLIKLIPSQHFTQPPPRYSEATLIKALEQNGIGRPSTYAPILSTVQERNYIEKDEQKKFKPTEIGLAVNDLLVEHFPQIVDIKFTAKMEEDLDKIARGQEKWVPMLTQFYEPFAKRLLIKYKEIDKMVVQTKEICEKCGKPMVIRMGRYGKFLACSGFPECKNTRPLTSEQDKELDKGNPSKEKCDKCGAEMVLKKGRYGAFWACSAYPECKNVKNIKKTTGLICPLCQEGEIVERRTKRNKIFWGCERYPKCDYATWEKPEDTDVKTK